MLQQHCCFGLPLLYVSFPFYVYSVVLQDAWNFLVYTSKLLADLVILVKKQRE